ncbi:hypothetical protein BV22DRAFT_123495 [Leucogyrophana mollusca]|uniref:Uncharacterized protein n=1 Tax=Leucogyrophana mollusca TaxID=85980 RepID=A0ACB8BUF0_9AGAM|nr:hypothetical protein BV22DRAFT_123495 [Leucogyrophana mollusca]
MSAPVYASELASAHFPFFGKRKHSNASSAGQLDCDENSSLFGSPAVPRHRAKSFDLGSSPLGANLKDGQTSGSISTLPERTTYGLADSSETVTSGPDSAYPQPSFSNFDQFASYGAGPHATLPGDGPGNDACGSFNVSDFEAFCNGGDTGTFGNFLGQPAFPTDDPFINESEAFHTMRKRTVGEMENIHPLPSGRPDGVVAPADSRSFKPLPLRAQKTEENLYAPHDVNGRRLSSSSINTNLGDRDEPVALDLPTFTAPVADLPRYPGAGGGTDAALASIPAAHPSVARGREPVVFNHSFEGDNGNTDTLLPQDPHAEASNLALDDFFSKHCGPIPDPHFSFGNASCEVEPDADDVGHREVPASDPAAMNPAVLALPRNAAGLIIPQEHALPEPQSDTGYDPVLPEDHYNAGMSTTVAQAAPSSMAPPSQPVAGSVDAQHPRFARQTPFAQTNHLGQYSQTTVSQNAQFLVPLQQPMNVPYHVQPLQCVQGAGHVNIVPPQQPLNAPQQVQSPQVTLGAGYVDVVRPGQGRRRLNAFAVQKWAELSDAARQQIRNDPAARAAFAQSIHAGGPVASSSVHPLSRDVSMQSVTSNWAPSMSHQPMHGPSSQPLSRTVSMQSAASAPPMDAMSQALSRAGSMHTLTPQSASIQQPLTQGSAPTVPQGYMHILPPHPNQVPFPHVVQGPMPQPQTPMHMQGYTFLQAPSQPPPGFMPPQAVLMVTPEGQYVYAVPGPFPPVSMMPSGPLQQNPLTTQPAPPVAPPVPARSRARRLAAKKQPTNQFTVCDGVNIDVRSLNIGDATFFPCFWPDHPCGMWIETDNGAAKDHLVRWHNIEFPPLSQGIKCRWPRCDSGAHHSEQNIGRHIVSHGNFDYQCEGCKKCYKSRRDSALRHQLDGPCKGKDIVKIVSPDIRVLSTGAPLSEEPPKKKSRRG